MIVVAVWRNLPDSADDTLMYRVEFHVVTER